METDYRNLLNIKEDKRENPKNTLKVWVEWDSNDADYIEKTTTMKPERLFGNKKLIYCLAYASCPYDFKGHEWNDAAFCHHITYNYDIEDLCSIISDNDFMAYSDWGDCHTLCNMEIIYYDDNGTPFLVTFDDIIEQFSEMSYEEICDFINEIPDEDNEDEEDY